MRFLEAFFGALLYAGLVSVVLVSFIARYADHDPLTHDIPRWFLRIVRWGRKPLPLSYDQKATVHFDITIKLEDGDKLWVARADHGITGHGASVAEAAAMVTDNLREYVLWVLEEAKSEREAD